MNSGILLRWLCLAAILVAIGVADVERPSLGRAGEGNLKPDICILPAIGVFEFEPHHTMWGKSLGRPCASGDTPLLLSVTHENSSNNHVGSKNFIEGFSTYMADYDPETDIGRWLVLKQSNDYIKFGLNTIDYSEINTKTGWPLRAGHLFTGLNDNSPRLPITGDIKVEFDLKIFKYQVLDQGSLGGGRFIIGAKAEWAEALPRSNRNHFLEVDLLISPGFAQTYKERIRPGCKDASYDRCFYSETGKFAEGRQLAADQVPAAMLRESWLSDGWRRYSIDITRLYRTLAWKSVPSSWSDSHITGFYLGVEVIGGVSLIGLVRNYAVRGK